MLLPPFQLILVVLEWQWHVRAVTLSSPMPKNAGASRRESWARPVVVISAPWCGLGEGGANPDSLVRLLEVSFLKPISTAEFGAVNEIRWVVLCGPSRRLQSPTHQIRHPEQVDCPLRAATFLQSGVKTVPFASFVQHPLMTALQGVGLTWCALWALSVRASLLSRGLPVTTQVHSALCTQALPTAQSIASMWALAGVLLV